MDTRKYIKAHDVEGEGIAGIAKRAQAVLDILEEGEKVQFQAAYLAERFPNMSYREAMDKLHKDTEWDIQVKDLVRQQEQRRIWIQKILTEAPRLDTFDKDLAQREAALAEKTAEYDTNVAAYKKAAEELARERELHNQSVESLHEAAHQIKQRVIGEVKQAYLSEVKPLFEAAAEDLDKRLTEASETIEKGLDNALQ